MIIPLLILAVLLGLPVLQGVSDLSEEFSQENCNLYCAAAPELTVSGSLQPQDELQYDASQLHDGLRSSAWVVAKGEGEWLQFTFRQSEWQRITSRQGVTEFFILNGYTKSEEHWRDHGRVRDLDLLMDGEVIAKITLLDSQDPQRVALPKIPLYPDITLRFVIRSIYAGDRFRETAVSEVRVDGYGAH